MFEERSQQGMIFEFESTVEAVVNGVSLHLKTRFDAIPCLSMPGRADLLFRPACGPCHALLHYIAANGVEAYRQNTPSNSIEIARALLTAGAEPDALADMYGAACTTMTLLVSSSHPAEAGLQVPLIELLLDSGAAIEGRGTRKWGTPLFTPWRSE